MTPSGAHIAKIKNNFLVMRGNLFLMLNAHKKLKNV